MAITTILGLSVGLFLIMLVIYMQGGLGLLTSFFRLTALIITVGCSLTAIFTSYSFPEIVKGFSAIRYAFKQKMPTPAKIIEQLVNIAIKARREGFLSLREETTGGKIPLLDLGLGLVADGTDPEVTKEIMETAAASESAAIAANERLWRDLGVYTPMFGMIGTVIGLIIMLRGLTDPSKIGPAMALALLTTLYGLAIAAVFCLPLAGKIHYYNEQLALVRDLIIEGILSIQAGYNSQIVEERLRAYLGRK